MKEIDHNSCRMDAIGNGFWPTNAVCGTLSASLQNLIEHEKSHRTPVV
jgi:hypothetical protein